MPAPRIFDLITRPCGNCGVAIARPAYAVNLSRKNWFCSSECKRCLYSIIFSGENNPNHGRRWSEEKRAEASARVRREFLEDPRRRFVSGSANRGKKFGPERRARMSEDRIGVPGRPHSDVSKAKIGMRSRAKFTDEYKKKARERLIELGLCVPDSGKDAYLFYRGISNWVRKMWDLDDLNCPMGVDPRSLPASDRAKFIRDHMYSRFSGFTNGVFPEIMRHPENCALITRAENTRKSMSKQIPSDSLCLGELFSRIESSDRFSWFEHGLCLDRIKEYRDGKRFFAKDYVRD